MTLTKKVIQPRLGLAIFLFVSLLLVPTRPAQAADDFIYFPQTGHNISGKFYTYWQNNGGLPVFGYPITDAKMETDPETGKAFLTQWFERNRFELHPENAGTKYEVLLGLLGKDLRREALSVDPDFQRAAPLRLVNGHYIYFEQTGHNLASDFFDYWNAQGGLERFGYPISEGHMEVDPTTGKTFYMQWFERARFELHPENKAPYTVLLGLLGNDIKYKTGPTSFMWNMQNSMKQPISIASDKQNNFFVADYATNQIFKFNSKGQLLKQWGSTGNGPGQFSSPRGMTVDNTGNVYVVDTARTDTSGQNSRIQKFDNNGNFLLTFGKFGEEPGNFIVPVDVAVDSTTNNIYVVDTVNGVQIFDKNGRFMRQLGTDGSGDGQFQIPNSIAIDTKGNIYVGDNSRGVGVNKARLQKFDNRGNFVGKYNLASGEKIFDMTIDRTLDGLYLVTDQAVYNVSTDNFSPFKLLPSNKQINVSGLLNSAIDVAVDSDFNVYIVDRENKRVSKFMQNG